MVRLKDASGSQTSTGFASLSHPTHFLVVHASATSLVAGRESALGAQRRYTLSIVNFHSAEAPGFRPPFPPANPESMGDVWPPEMKHSGPKQRFLVPHVPSSTTFKPCGLGQVTNGPLPQLYNPSDGNNKHGCSKGHVL